MSGPGKAAQLRRGAWVLLALLVLTVLELPVALRLPRPLPYLVMINLADAALIVWYFMHVRDLWRTEG